MLTELLAKLPPADRRGFNAAILLLDRKVSIGELLDGYQHILNVAVQIARVEQSGKPLITDPCLDCGRPIRRPVPASGKAPCRCLGCTADRERAATRKATPTTRQGRRDAQARRAAGQA